MRLQITMAKAEAFATQSPRSPDLSNIIQAVKRRRYVGAGCFLLFLILCFGTLRSTSPATPLPVPASFDSSWEYPRDAKKLSLSPQQCEAAFPGLSYEVTRNVRDRNGNKLSLQDIDSIPKQNGYVRAMIYDNEVSPSFLLQILPLALVKYMLTLTSKLYVLETEGKIYSRGLASLLDLHRAIVTSPGPLPNIEFTFSSDDKLPPRASWAYARQKNDRSTWLMPDFSFYSWPETKVGSYGEVQGKVKAMEETALNPSGQAWPWDVKLSKLLWRGATMGLPLRDAFVKMTTEKPWADVKTLDWHDKNSTDNDLKSTDEHCQYKFLAHTEGNSYSGRLKNLLNCRSVVIAHEMDWYQHFSHLLSSTGDLQNYVEVRRDFSDLESTMKQLLNNDEDAKRVADNSVKIFRERYLTPAAETCYWRSLIQGWRQVLNFEPKIWAMDEESGEMKRRGVPIESYVLERRLEWDPY